MFLLGELKKCDLLRPLTDDQFDEMVAVAKRREIKKTEFIIKEDEDGKEIFVLEHGRIEVSYYDEDGTRKKLKEIDAPGMDESYIRLLSLVEQTDIQIEQLPYRIT